MRGLFTQQHGEDVEFELFSNIVLKFTAILIVVMVLLALNVGQRLDSIISPNSFTGGLARPTLYIGAWDLGDPQSKSRFDDGGYYVSLNSPSLEAASTDVKGGKTVSNVQGETFSGDYGGTIKEMLGVLAGIDPGQFVVEGATTPLLVPFFTKKHLVPASSSDTDAIPPDSQLALRLLQIWNSSYKNKIYPVRAYEEFRKARARIYVELVGQEDDKRIVIGHPVFDQSNLKAGSLDFLTGLSSANAEVVYLGSLGVDFDKQSDSRISFFESHGFPAAAEAFRRFSFPREADLAEAMASGIPAPQKFNSLSDDVRSQWIKGAGGVESIARSRFDLVGRVTAFHRYKDDLLAAIIRNGGSPKASDLPPILAFPDAWKAYVNERLSQKPVPPKWLIEEFLGPLGFDKRVVLLEEQRHK